MVNLTPIFAAAILAGTAFAHPGEHHDHNNVEHQLVRRAEHAASIQKRLDNCQSHPAYAAIKARGQERRFKAAEERREKRGILLDSQLQSAPAVLISLS